MVYKKQSSCCNAKVVVYNDQTYCDSCIGACNVNHSMYSLFKNIATTLFIGLFLSLYLGVKAPNEINHFRYNIIEKTNLLIDTDIRLTDADITAEMKRDDVDHIEIAIPIMRLETANYTSQICRENKNLCGMKYVHQKLALGEKNGHAYYKTYKDCILDFKRSQQYYIRELNRKWSEVNDYSLRLKGIKP